MKFAVQEYADAFNCHVKTILRAATGEPHPSDWAPEPIDHYRVAEAFSMNRNLLLAVMQGKDKLITVEDTADKLGKSVRRLHQRRAAGDKDYIPAASHGRIVRYSLAAIENLRDGI